MVEYRLYYLDRGGHILKAFDIKAADDAQALAVFQQHPADRDMEIWQGVRYVGKFDRAPPKARAS